MPSGPPELHAYWCAQDPDGLGDEAAIRHLRQRGFILTKRAEWRQPAGMNLSDLDVYAIQYMILEWDFGGIEKPEEG